MKFCILKSCSLLVLLQITSATLAKSGERDAEKTALWHHLITATKQWSDNFIKEYESKFDNLAQIANVSKQCKDSVSQTFNAISNLEDWAHECKSKLSYF
jgi:hypothetical protein